MLTFAYPLSLYHHVQYISLPQDSAVAPWHCPLLLQIYSFTPELPRRYYSFAASRYTIMGTSWYCYVLTTVLSTTMQRTCWLLLAVDCPGQQSVHFASVTVFYASIGTARLRYPRPIAITFVFCNFPFLNAWHISWQHACGSDAFIFPKHTSIPHKMQGSVWIKKKGGLTTKRKTKSKMFTLYVQ